MSRRASRLATLLLLCMLIVPSVGSASVYGAAPSWPPGPSQSADRVPGTSVSKRWIVRLADPPMAQAPGLSPKYAVMTEGAAASGRLQLDTLEAQQYRAKLEQRQAAALSAIQHVFPSAKLQRSYQVVFNGMSVMLPGADATAAQRLRALPGVAAVYEDLVYKPSMYSSIPLIGADKLWAYPAIGGQANAGAGIKIAIIDSGIKIDNPFFNPAGFKYPSGYPKGDPAHTTPKVIVSRAYFRPDLPPLAGDDTSEPGPDDSSHGTHVAGTAAGVANTVANFNGLERTISGVAPRAYLMSYKVFYENDSPFSGQSFATESIAAFEDAVADGADVISNSWGGRAEVEPSADPIVAAADAAVDAGVTVVFAAGNDGPNPSTAGSPGFSSKVITVGATTTAQTIASGFVDVVAPDGVPDTLKQQPYGTADFGAPISDNLFGPAAYLPLAALGGSTLACDALPAGSLSGHVALIERGVCPFSLKVYNAQQGGAIGAIIYNSEAGGEEIINMAGGQFADQVTIPAISLPRSVGLGMIDWYGKSGGAAQVQIDPRPRVIDQTPDVLASFSSRGPTLQGSLKPDVVAPGVNILSSGFGSGEGLQQHLGFGMVSGTSMATPHVAGSAALLKQVHPSWTPANIKSALMSTAVTDVWLDQDKTEVASVLDRGAGRIDLAHAGKPELLFDQPSLSFGTITPSADQPTSATLSVNVRGTFTGRPRTYTVTAKTSAGDFSISIPSGAITVGVGGTAHIDVAISLPAGAAPGDYEGEVMVSSSIETLHLPLWARALPATRGPNKVLLIDNDGSSSLELRDYSGYYGNALSALGIPFTYLDVDALAGQDQTLPAIGELQKYEIVIWFTGDNYLASGQASVPTPLTEADQDVLIAYLQSGGNLIATGQDLTQASDINNSPPNDPRYFRSDLYHSYLGARFVQEDVFTNTATLERTLSGTSAQTWTTGISLDVSAPGGDHPELSDKTGAGNQASIDEATVADFDPRWPDKYTTAIFRAASTANQGAGTVGLNRAAEPTLEQPAPDIPYRSTYLSFGLEGVRSDTGATTRLQLLQSLLYWHVDRPTVQVTGPAVVSGPNQLASFTAAPQSNTPTSFVRYRWDFGDGSAILETDQATVVHRYAKAGTYQARVEVTDSWGHRALSTGAGGGVMPSGSSSSPAASSPAASSQGGAGAGSATLAFAQTGQTLQGRFLQYWQSNGGLAVFGYPIGAQGGAPLSQTFERTRFEYHPENAAPYDVLLGRVGADALTAQGRDWRAFPTVDQAVAGCSYFAETKHSVCGAFKTYWEQHGLEFNGQAGSSYAESLALFGLPLSEMHQETNADGSTVMVQWFERARFELHPENAAPYNVLLGRLGSELYQ